MQISKTISNGSARDEALKRRNSAMREALGMAPSRGPSKPQEPKTGETLSSSDGPAT
jgi:hypothetical protein